MSTSPRLSAAARVDSSGMLRITRRFTAVVFPPQPAPQHEALHGGRLAPVAVEGLQGQLDARLEAHEAERAGPHRRLPEAVLTYLLDVLLGHDPRGPGGARAVERHEVRPGVLQV